MSTTTTAVAARPEVWARGLSVGERVPFDARGATPEGGDRVATLPARWLREAPYASPNVLPRRLAAAGIDEASLARLVRLPAVAAPTTHPPDWAARLDTLLGGTDPDVDASGEHALSSWLPGFAAIAQPIANAAWRRARATLASGGLGTAARAAGVAALPLLVPALARRVTQWVSRTMVLELHVARLRGELAGDTSEERYASFCTRLRDPAVRRALLTEYVVLARTLLDTADDWADAAAEFAARWAADAATLRRTFFADGDPGDMVEVRAAGDSHARGRCVQIVTYASGSRVVYKPRSLAADAAYASIAEWLNAAGFAPTLWSPATVDRGAYGWAAFVAQDPCADREGVCRFYERLGGHLALLYAVDGTDMHFENVIANGEHPALVDLEALFHPRLPTPAAATPSAEVGWTALRQSVVRVGLLPTWLGNGPEAAEVSGLGGASGPRLSTERLPVLADPQTDAVRVERRRVLAPPAANRPRLSSRPADAREHVDSIVAGFERAYAILADRRGELLAASAPLRVFDDVQTRAVLRDTRTYGILLTECPHPDHLRDAAERDRHLDRLWASVAVRPYLSRFVDAEQAALRRGDVPMFFARPQSTSLWTQDGVEIPGVLDHAPLAAVRQRLATLGDADRRRQVRLIRATLATLGAARVAEPLGTSAPDPARRAATERLASAPRAAAGTLRRRWAAVARECCDRVLDAAIDDGGSGEEVNWLAVTAFGDRAWTVRPLGDDLYAGRPGVALFLAYAGRVLGDARATAVARRVVASVTRDLDRAFARDDADATFTGQLGGYQALGGAVYLLSHVGVLWDRPDLHARATTVAARIADLAERDEALDVIGGCAGAVLALRVLAGVSPGVSVDDAIRRCADRLVATASPRSAGVAWTTPMPATEPLTGASHGASGIAWALAVAAAHTGGQAYAHCAAQALAYERACYVDDLANWPDFRAHRDADVTGARATAYWCHGAPGIGLVRAALVTLGWTCPTVRDDLARAARTTLTSFGGNHSLCHGDLGNLETLVRAARVPGVVGQGSLAWAERAILADIESRGPTCGESGSVETPGLMMGLSGVGLGALRQARPGRVPSPLAFDAPPTRYLRRRA